LRTIAEPMMPAPITATVGRASLPFSLVITAPYLCFALRAGRRHLVIFAVNASLSLTVSRAWSGRIDASGHLGTPLTGPAHTG
jgi:hypothetical protein